MSISNKPKEYWAAEEDAESLAENCWARAENYFQRLRNTQWWRTIFRNWAYYHGLFFDPSTNHDWSAVKELGSDGGSLAVGINHFRNFLDHLFALTTQQRADFKTRARSSGHEAEIQARWGDDILEHYMRDANLENYIDEVTRHALILTAGYLYAPWDWNEGEEYAAEERPGEKMRMYKKGDFSFHLPTVFDVVYDLGVRNFDKIPWAIIRTYENRWDLAERAENQEIADRIVALDYASNNNKEDSLFRFGVMGAHGTGGDLSDIIPVMNFWHEKTDSMPSGAQFRFINDEIPLGDPEPISLSQIPLFRQKESEIIFTTLGYSKANDLQAPQEIANAEFSTIASNHKATGFQVIAVPDGWDLEEDYLSEGIVLIRGTGPMPPQGISFTAPQGEFYKLYELSVQAMEFLSGVNSVARGQPEANLKSGEALKVMDSKAVQFVAPLIKSRAQMLEKLGTYMLRTLRDKIKDTDQERIVAIVGESERPHLSKFTADNLEEIDRVTVDVGNPLSKTVAGRLALLEIYQNNGMLKTPEEIQTLVETGSIKPVLKGNQSQLDLIKDENEVLRSGGNVQINWALDNHILHLREHNSVINSTEIRNDPMISQSVLSHSMEHLQALMYQPVQQLQASLGYGVPFPPQFQEMPPGLMEQMGMPGGAPGGAPGGMPGGGPGGMSGSGSPQAPTPPGQQAPPQVDTAQQNFDQSMPVEVMQ